MQNPILTVEVHCDLARVAECARQMKAALPETQWTVAAALAAEILAIHEAAATGSRVLVIPAGQLGDSVAKELGRGAMNPVR